MKNKPKRTKSYDATRWLRNTVEKHERRMDAQPLEQDRATTIAIGHHMSFELLLSAQDDSAWYVVAGQLSLARHLAVAGVGEEFVPEIHAAMGAMMDARKSFDSGSGLLLTDSGRQAVAVALEIHDQQVNLANRAELSAAAKAVIDEIAVKGDEYEYLPEAA
jgi:hypothetical protein